MNFILTCMYVYTVRGGEVEVRSTSTHTRTHTQDRPNPRPGLGCSKIAQLVSMISCTRDYESTV